MSLWTSLRFFIHEALINCRRAGMMGLATVSTIAVSLLMTGGFMLATQTVESFIARLQTEALITGFLSAATTPEVAAEIRTKVAALDEVAEVVLVPPGQALDELFLDPSDKQLLTAGLGSEKNPLPYTVRIKLKRATDLQSLLTKLRAISFIDDVAYGKEALQEFRGFSDLLWNGSLLMVILLGTGSLFIVANTVRLTLMMRREEIEIMRLVGATHWFIRWPFIIEGLIHGVVGAVIANVLLFIGHKFIVARLAILIPFFRLQLEAAPLFKLMAKLGMLGIVLGVAGSLLTLRDLRAFSRHAAPASDQ